MNTVTNENASKYETFNQTDSYFLIPETFDGKQVMISLMKKTEQNCEEIARETLFTKPLEDIPKNWLEGLDIAIIFEFSKGKLFISRKLHLLKKVCKSKRLHPLFDDSGKCYGSDEYFTTVKYFLGNKKKHSFKVATHTLEEQPMALLWVIQIHGEDKFRDKKSVPASMLPQLGLGDYKKAFFAVPVYINGHLAGAKIVSELTPTKYCALHTAITASEFERL